MGKAYRDQGVKSIAEVRELVVRNIHKNLAQKSVGDLQFAIIEDSLILYIEYLRSYDGIILVHTHWSATKQFVKSLRTHRELKLSLKPLFIYGLPLGLMQENQLTIDGKVLDLNLFDDIVFHTQKINESIQEVDQYEVDGFDYLIHRTILFYKTRGIESIKPFHSSDSKIGYAFPYLSLFIADRDKANELNAIQYGIDQKWLLSEYLDATYVCNHCESGFLTYREVCPSCSSSNLKELDIIHHFRCAHVGPLSDYIEDDDRIGSLVCPKCYRELNHVGVDYDRPSVIQHCNNCHKEFQAYSVMARCCSCHQDTPVEHLKKKSIYNYTITPKGFKETILQLKNPVSHLGSQEKVLQPDWMLPKKALHDYMMEIENTMAQRSFLSIVRMKKAQELIDKVGKGNVNDIGLELCSILHTHFPSAKIAFQNRKFYLVQEMRNLDKLNEEFDKIDLLMRTALQDNLGIEVADFFGYKHMTIYDYVHDWYELLDLMQEGDT